MELGRIIGKFPEFANRCDWNKLSGAAWIDLILLRPEFSEKCDWSKVAIKPEWGSEWEQFWHEYPEFVQYRIPDSGEL